MAEPRRNIPRERLRPVGGGGSDAVTLSTRAAAVVALLAVVILAWAAFAPLAKQPVVQAPDLPDIKALHVPSAPDAGARGEMIAALTQAHIFTPDRTPWGAVTQHELANTNVAEPEPAPISQDTGDPATPLPVVVKLDDVEKVEKKIKTSFETIRLRGILTLPDRPPAAMLGVAHSKEPERSRTIVEGETFDVPRAKNEESDEWTLVRVDVARKCVYVRHGSATLGIALFPDKPIEAGEVTVAAAPQSPGDASISPEQAQPTHTPDGRPVPRVLTTDQATALAEIEKRMAELEGRGDITPEDLAELMTLTASMPPKPDRKKNDQEDGAKPDKNN